MALLSVTVTENDGVTRYRYELSTTGGPVPGALEQEYSIEVDPPFVRGLCREIDKTLAAALSGEPGYRDKLVVHGRTLYDHLFGNVHGSDEPALMVKIRESRNPLMVRTNEREVPWELLHDGTQFLGLANDLGQGSVVPMGSSRKLNGRDVGRLDRVLIVGDPLGDLAAARREAEHIARWLEERGTRCTVLLGEQATLVSVVNELRSTPFDLLHFCGHVTVRNSRPADSGLLLHSRQLLNERTLRTASQEHEGAPPVVFVNGCRTVGPISNLCLSFMTLGARVVVGTRAEVAEESARRFAEEFYRRLLDDETAGAAIRGARHSVLDAPDGAWASFLLYGNPSVHITGGSSASARSSEERPTGERWGVHSPEAVALMDRARNVAHRRGVVISLDLLYGLVTCPELQASMQRSVGPDRLSVLVEMLNVFVGATPGLAEHHSTATGNGQAQDVPLSDTVDSVLIQAKDHAADEGRSAVAPRDIAAAFAETGGGNSARLMEISGISLRRLLSPRAEPTDGATAAFPPNPSDDLFDDTGRLRADLLEAGPAEAVQAALLLAGGKRQVIYSHTLLQGFGLAGSPALQQALEKQGEAGRQAARVLSSSLRPRRKDMSKRSVVAFEQAQGVDPETPIGEATLLLALLDDHNSGARQVLEQFGVGSEQLIRDLRTAE